MNIITIALHVADAAVAFAKVSTTRADDIKMYDEALTVIREARAEQDHFAASDKMVAEPLQILPGGGAFPFVEVGYVGEFVAPTESLPAGTPLCVAPVQPVKQEPVMDYEHICALRESEQIQAGDSYFFVRPENDTPTSRKMFFQGFERGFHKGLKYTAPVRTKDLTDDEIKAIALPMIPDEECSSEDQANFLAIEVIRAVIAADRKKNK